MGNSLKIAIFNSYDKLPEDNICDLLEIALNGSILDKPIMYIKVLEVIHCLSIILHIHYITASGIIIPTIFIVSYIMLCIYIYIILTIMLQLVTYGDGYTGYVYIYIQQTTP